MGQILVVLTDKQQYMGLTDNTLLGNTLKEPYAEVAHGWCNFSVQFLPPSVTHS